MSVSPRWVPALGKIMGGVFTGLGGLTLLAIALSRWGTCQFFLLSSLYFFLQVVLLTCPLCMRPTSFESRMWYLVLFISVWSQHCIELLTQIVMMLIDVQSTKESRNSVFRMIGHLVERNIHTSMPSLKIRVIKLIVCLRYAITSKSTLSLTFVKLWTWVSLVETAFNTDWKVSGRIMQEEGLISRHKAHS